MGSIGASGRGRAALHAQPLSPTASRTPARKLLNGYGKAVLEVSDDFQGGSSGQPPQSEGPAASSPSVKKKGVPSWVWIVVALVAIGLVALYVTQTPQGHRWLLAIRGMASVPSVVGQTESEAGSTLQNAGFSLGHVSEEPTLAAAPGVVLAQQPVADTDAKKDSAVDVTVSAVPAATVPNVVGQSESNAVTLLAEEGLRTGTVTYVYDAKTAAGSVTAQQPAASTESTVGEAVDLTVSKGKQQGQVPNVIGLSQDDANAVITSAGFKVTIVKATSASVPAGDVIAQSPAAGVTAPTGSAVTITVSTGASASTSSNAAPSTPATKPPTTPSNPSTSPPKPSEPVPSKVEVPDVVGKRVLDAVTTLRRAQLKVSFEFAPSTTSILKVVSQDPASGATVDPGTTVIVTISLPSLSLPGGKPTQPTPLPAEQPSLESTTPSGSAPSPQPEPTASPSP